ncbi:universal stress protein [Nocardioides caricicola]|uniref:Universal stress protein n=1 Tax=Nocardioides caricicola TaxID=634770 RepID=A0ABW0N6Z3_9ACTN
MTNSLPILPATPGNVVVVGVDGSEANRGALRYAVAEARSTGAALKLVHVVPDHLPTPALVPVTPQELDDLGHQFLRDAAETVRALDPDLAVEGWLHHGTRPVELAHGAEGARVLVVGRDGRPLLERLLRGDTATGVAARAAVPVVEVPADWSPRPPDADHVVVVAVKVADRAATLLADAFGLAAQRAATLVVLHATKSDSRAATLGIEAVLRDWRARFPDVKVDVRVVPEPASDAVVAASRDADLVVVGRRGRGVPAATHLGTTARAVLRAAHSPVRVVATAERGWSA